MIDISKLTESEKAEILTKAARLRSFNETFPTFEALFTSPAGFELTTATNVQLAICRTLDGLPMWDLWQDPIVRKCFGNPSHEYMESLIGHPPKDLVVVAAIRGAKSLIAAARGVWASQKVNVSKVRKRGEIPRFSITSLELDNAKVTLGHLMGMKSKPALAKLMIDVQGDDPRIKPWKEIISMTEEGAVGSVFLWHPMGIPIEIRVVAMKKAGSGQTSRWSAGLVLDEAAKMAGSGEAAMNYDDERRAAVNRLLPGGQIISIGSPWAPFGPIYEIVQRDFGKPSPRRVVIRATGPELNPYHWTPEMVAESEETARREGNMIAHLTDCLAEFADVSDSLYPQHVLNRVRSLSNEPEPYNPAYDYAAAMDPATRGNAWTLVIGTRHGKKKRCIFAKQWQGTPDQPLSPKAVFAQISEVLSEYNLDSVTTDQYAIDFARDIAGDQGVTIIEEAWTQENKVEAHLALASAMTSEDVELIDNTLLFKDLRLVQKRVTQKAVTIHMPETADRRHCDFAPPLALLFKQWLDEEHDVAPNPGDSGYDKWYVGKMLAEDTAMLQSENQDPMFTGDDDGSW